MKKLKKHNGKRAITEVYNPHRVAAWAKRMPGFGVVPGLALDLAAVDDNGVAWDFVDAADISSTSTPWRRARGRNAAPRKRWRLQAFP